MTTVHPARCRTKHPSGAVGGPIAGGPDRRVRSPDDEGPPAFRVHEHRAASIESLPGAVHAGDEDPHPPEVLLGAVQRKRDIEFLARFQPPAQLDRPSSSLDLHVRSPLPLQGIRVADFRPSPSRAVGTRALSTDHAIEAIGRKARNLHALEEQFFDGAGTGRWGSAVWQTCRV